MDPLQKAHPFTLESIDEDPFFLAWLMDPVQSKDNTTDEPEVYFHVS